MTSILYSHVWEISSLSSKSLTKGLSRSLQGGF
nr:MAG TPA: hypothetical protein [Caudoviricetes sp.]